MIEKGINKTNSYNLLQVSTRRSFVSKYAIFGPQHGPQHNLQHNSFYIPSIKTFRIFSWKK